MIQLRNCSYKTFAIALYDYTITNRSNNNNNTNHFLMYIIYTQRMFAIIPITYFKKYFNRLVHIYISRAYIYIYTFQNVIII